MVEIRVEGVSFTYDSAKVLEGVSFTAASGELLGILGPNGSGKTTLLRTVYNALRPQVGAVMIDGHEVARMGNSEVAKKIAVVPQEAFANLSLTALEVVLIGRSPYISSLVPESSKDVAIAAEAMKVTRCIHLADRRMTSLSGGEKRRVILARALAQEAKVLLLDEPTVNLDVRNQLELMESLRRLCGERGVTVLSVFHDFSLAARYSDRILLVKDGKVFSFGRPEEVLTVENLREVFGVEVEITRHRTAGIIVTSISTAVDSPPRSARAEARV